MKGQPAEGPYANDHFEVLWNDSGKWPTQPPHREWPNGVGLDISAGAEFKCTVALPYPAPRIGIYEVRCVRCGYSAMVTTAGRVDDPKTLTVPCKARLSGGTARCP